MKDKIDSFMSNSVYFIKKSYFFVYIKLGLNHLKLDWCIDTLSKNFVSQCYYSKIKNFIILNFRLLSPS